MHDRAGILTQAGLLCSRRELLYVQDMSPLGIRRKREPKRYFFPLPARGGKLSRERSAGRRTVRRGQFRDTLDDADHLRGIQSVVSKRKTTDPFQLLRILCEAREVRHWIAYSYLYPNRRVLRQRSQQTVDVARFAVRF